MSKSDSRMLSGIAILFMLLLHTAGGEWKGVKSLLFPDMVITHIALFGKICVSIFAFISGYGLWSGYRSDQNKNGENIRNVGRVIVRRFFKWGGVFWPICFLAALQKMFYEGDFSVTELIKNMIGLNNYGSGWWYVRYYECMIFVEFPIMVFVDRLTCEWKLRKSIYCFPMITIAVSIISLVLDRMGYTGSLSLLIFAMGIIVCEYKHFFFYIEKMPGHVLLTGWMAFLLRCVFTGNGRMTLDVICVPLMALTLITFCKEKCIFRKVLYFIGGYSTPMWLLHPLTYKYNNYIQYCPDAVLGWILLVFVSLILSIFYKKMSQMVTSLFAGLFNHTFL